MKVVLLGGGTGKRMLPLTEDKFLLKFVGKTLLEHQVLLANEAGLNDFIIVGNPQNIGKIESIITGIPGINFDLAVQKDLPGIAGALQSAAGLLTDTVIVVNPNDVFEISAYQKLIEIYRSGNGISSLLGYTVNDYFPGGYLLTDEKGWLTGIVEKPPRGQEPSKLVNIMVHLHSEPQRLLDYMKGVPEDRDDIYECAIGIMAKDTRNVAVVPYHGSWNAIKYPWHIPAVVKHFLDRNHNYISPTASISDRAVITGNVIIGDNVRILENALVKGPVYIGPNSVIGNNCLVRDYSHIGADCTIGYSTEIKNSYIDENCEFHMSYAGDSIIGHSCSFGAGTILSNYRFDKQNITVTVDGERIDTGLNKLGAIIGNNCRTGVNASIMPGIKIGSNSIVGAQVCLTEDLGPDTIILAETPSYKIVKNRIRSATEKQASQPDAGELKCAE